MDVKNSGIGMTEMKLETLLLGCRRPNAIVVWLGPNMKFVNAVKPRVIKRLEGVPYELVEDDRKIDFKFENGSILRLQVPKRPDHLPEPRLIWIK